MVIAFDNFEEAQKEEKQDLFLFICHGASKEPFYIYFDITIPAF